VFLDFFVEHLSSTLNCAESDDINRLLTNRTATKMERLRTAALARDMAHHKTHFANDVVVIIPFALRSGLSNTADNDATQKLRLLFFESTFWSIYRYFPHIVVSVSRKFDYDGLLSLNLPLFDIFTSFEQESPPVHHNVQQALLKAHSMMTTNMTWDSLFRFVYFTEGDSILHMRSHRHLYAVLETTALEGALMLTPHRMQTMPIPQNLPKDTGSIPEWKRKA
jgi:hypothetical protein